EPLTRAFSVVLLDVYGEQLEAQAVVLLVERLQMRHLLPARHAPSRPEIHHDDLALQLCQRNLLTLVRLKREAGRRARHGRSPRERRDEGGQRENRKRAQHVYLRSFSLEEERDP